LSQKKDRLVENAKSGGIVRCGLVEGKNDIQKELSMSTLYERLGETNGITAIVNDVVDLHVQNPLIGTRFASSDVDSLKNSAANFFIAGSGGPNVYEGKDMLSAHRGMNIDNAEFVAVLDDVMQALDMHDIGQREKEEVLHILYSMKGDIVRV
jgi:hemoglobin